MKKVELIISTLTIIALSMAVIIIERKKKTPMDRYLETVQSSVRIQVTSEISDKRKYIPKEIINDGGNLKYEFLSCDLIDDEDIANQTKYKAEYFIEGRVPESNYIVKCIDYDSMARDYPKFDEYRKSNHEKGMTKDEYEEFMRKHKADYTTDKHVKTKYLFIKCRITYTGGGRRDEYLHAVDVFIMRGNDLLGYESINCYFDHTQHTSKEARESSEFFKYKFEKKGDSIECVLGCRLTSEYFDLSEENKYFIGFQPGTSYSDDDQFNPAIDSRCVAIADIPKGT